MSEDEPKQQRDDVYVGKKFRLTDKKILEAYRANDFNKSKTAKALLMSSGTFYRILDKRPELRKDMDNALEDQVEIAESALMKLVDQGNFNAIKFFLETKGKSKGYGQQKQEGQTVDESASILSALNRKYSDHPL